MKLRYIANHDSYYSEWTFGGYYHREDGPCKQTKGTFYRWYLAGTFIATTRIP